MWLHKTKTRQQRRELLCRLSLYIFSTDPEDDSEPDIASVTTEVKYLFVT